MSFTVLRVDVQKWDDEEILLLVGGESEEGEEAYDVVKEKGNQEESGQNGERGAILLVFMIRAEGHRILNTFCIDIM